MTLIKSKKGFTISKITEKDENGDVVSVTFEVRDSQGYFVGSFSNLNDAEVSLDSELKALNEPSNALRM